MVKPGGTGTPRLVISASSQPFPPSRWRSALEPSALPLAKEYTYFGRRAVALEGLDRALLRALACAMRSTPSIGPVGMLRKKDRPRRGLRHPVMVCEGKRDVNKYSSATGTYETLARWLSSDVGSGLVRRDPTRGQLLTRPPGDKLFDSRQMSEHRLVRSRFVPAAYGFENAPVVVMRAGGPSRGQQALLAALSEEVHERIDDADDGAVVGGRGDGRVERGILGHPRLALRDLLRLFLEDAIHLGDLLAGGAPRSQSGEGRLEHPPRLEELAHGFAIRQDNEGERLDQCLDRDVPHEGALARADLDEAAALQ